jgi:hypothetical protein
MYIIKRFSHRHSSSIHFFLLNSTKNKLRKYNNNFVGNGIILSDNPLNECISSRTKNINCINKEQYENPLNECISSRTKNINRFDIKEYENPLNECEKEK